MRSKYTRKYQPAPLPQQQQPPIIIGEPSFGNAIKMGFGAGLGIEVGQRIGNYVLDGWD